MSLPVLSGQEVARRLERAGFQMIRRRGSHMILRRKEPKMTVSVPDHKELKKGTLRGLLRQIAMSLAEFEELA